MLQVLLLGIYTFPFITVRSFDSHYPSTHLISVYRNNLVLCGHSTLHVTKLNSVNQTKLNHWISWISSSKLKPPERQADHSLLSTSKNRKHGVDLTRVCFTSILNQYRSTEAEIALTVVNDQGFCDAAGNNKFQMTEMLHSKEGTSEWSRI